MAITDRTLELIAARRIALGQTLDAQELALVKAWVDAWDRLSPEFEASIKAMLADARDGKLTGAQVARNARLRKALDQAVRELDELSHLTEVTVENDLKREVLAAAQSQIEIAASQLPTGETLTALPTWTRVSEEALDAIVKRTTEQIHSARLPLAADAVASMRRNLVRGIAVGAHPSRVAARMVRQAESGFNGGLTRALVISRTEMLDAHRAADKASNDANAKVLAGWIWSAQMDSRTCPSCLAQHGQEHPLDEEGPEDHQCGRCARVPKTKSWKDLGFNVEEPPSLMPDSRAWFDSLTPETQKQIMGPARLELLQSGAVSWSDLSRKVSSDGWRDSMHVTPVRDLQALAAG